MLINITLFILLLAQNPFSGNNSLSDLYPYPDTIHYINPAISFLKGYGLKITREGRSLSTAVPPLYSVALMPFYLVSHDPRMFYFANVILALISAFLFLKVLRLVTKEKLDLIFVYFIYVTSYFIYWYPQLAMAENLALPIFLGGLYLLLTKISNLKLILSGIIGISLVATKYALIPLGISFYILFLIKILLEFRNHKIKFKTKILQLILLFSAGFASYALYAASEISNKNFDLLTHFQGPLVQLMATFNSHSDSLFSVANFSDGLIQYLAGFMGGPLGFAGLYRPIVPVFVGMLGLSVLFYGLVRPGIKFICFSLLLMLFSSIIFMSTFQAVDGRYIYHAIPILLIAFIISLSEIKKILAKKGLMFLYTAFLIGISAYYIFTLTGQIYTKINQNINGDGSSLNYNTVLEYNRFFQKNYKEEDKKPVVITSLVPYFVDFYSNGNYSILPLANIGYFVTPPQLIWGPGNYDDLFSVYSAYLKNGKDIYVSDSGIYFWNKKYLLSNFNSLKEKYNLNLVLKGCNGKCNLYKLQNNNL